MCKRATCTINILIKNPQSGSTYEMLPFFSENSWEQWQRHGPHHEADVGVCRWGSSWFSYHDVLTAAFERFNWLLTAGWQDEVVVLWGYTHSVYFTCARKVRVHTQLSGPPKQEVLMSSMSDKCFHSRSTFTQQLISGNFSSLYVSDCRHTQFFFLVPQQIIKSDVIVKEAARRNVASYLQWTRCWVQLLRWRASAILGRASCLASAGWARPSDSGQSCAAWVWAPLSPSLQGGEKVQTRF